MNIEQKSKKLRRILKDIDSAVIAFSGGVDSTFLAKIALETLKDKAVAVTIVTPFFSKEEERAALGMAKEIGIEHMVLSLKLPGSVMNNPEDRCYKCKKEVFSRLSRFAGEKGFGSVVEGSNKDDLKDYRPGRRALKELGVRSPLLEAGMTKEDIRSLSKREKLRTWNNPSCSCLAARIPYGELITPEKLALIGESESFLGGLGFEQVRLRLHGDIARIEVAKKDIPGLVRKSAVIGKKLKALGIKYVCADMEGYRTGSMNEGIAWKRKKY